MVIVKVKLQMISSKRQLLVQFISIQPTSILFPEAALQMCSKEKCSGNKLQTYRRTSMPKRDFNTEIALRHGCSSVYLQHIFTTPFYKSTYGRLFLYFPPTNHCFSSKHLLKTNNFLSN